MRSISRVRLGDAVVGLLPAAAIAANEGGWPAVVYASVQVGILGASARLSLWLFVTAAAVGILVARVTARRKTPGARVACVVGTAALGALLSADVDTLVRGAWGTVLTNQPGGWLLAVATWAGLRHPDPATDDLVVARSLAVGVPALGVPWLVGSGSANRGSFVDLALPATIVFVSSGLVAIGLARLQALGATAGLDWRRNRAWLGVLFGAVAAVALVSLPVAVVSGTSANALVGELLGPLMPVVRALAEAAAAPGRASEATGPGGASTSASTPPLGDAGPTAALPVVGLVVVGLVLVILLVWLFAERGSGRAATRQLGEERTIVLPRLAIRFGLPRLRLPRTPVARRPASASDAYLALLADFEDDDARRREPGETPAGHAHRLRRAGHGSLALDLLAADFQLERYAARPVSASERTRALDRWRALRPWRLSRRRDHGGSVAEGRR